MRAACCGLMCGVLMAMLAASGLNESQAWGQRPGAPANEFQPTGGLQTYTAPLGDGRQMLIAVDTAIQAVGVYYVDGSSGELSLKSVRNIRSDLQMTEYNGTAPFPQDIRAMLERGAPRATGEGSRANLNDARFP